jgi:class 3 adenylate cyclase
VVQAPVPLVCLMTKNDQLVPIIGLREGMDRKRLNTIREAAGSDVLDGEGVRYLAVDLPEGERGLREVVVAPVFEEGGGQRIGALVVGADPRTAMGSKLRQNRRDPRGEAITTGIVLGGEFFGETEEWESAAGGAADALIEKVEAKGKNGSEGAFEHDVPEGRVRVHFQRLTGGGQGAAPYHLALYSLGPLDAELAGLRNGALAAGGLGLALALVLGYVLARALTVPVRELSKGTGAVARGELDTRVPVRGGEMGQLAASFNTMTEGLAMKEKYRSVLGKVADEAVAEALVAGELELGGEEIVVSILFCDIRGFTSMSDGRAPSEVIALLNEHMTAMTEVVYSHCGVVDKFVGDEIMAIFGAPKAYGDDATNACRCALEMVATRARLNEDAAVPVEIGVGVATGRVVAGCMGSESRLNYTVVGDRVNLAARLCGIAGRGHVVIDGETRSVVDGFEGEESKVELKGIGSPVAIWRLDHLRDPQPSTAVSIADR